jgi:hypothetical protein
MNTALGSNALLSNTNGSNNTAIGLSALPLNTTGGSNLAIGNFALFNNIAGSGATAVGYSAMRYANNTATGYNNQNVAVGYEALLGTTTPAANTGNGNTAIGYISLQNNSSGNQNTSVGYNTLNQNSGGSRNTAIGANAMDNNTTGNNNTMIGYDADVSTGTLTNVTALGYNSKVRISNSLILGDTTNVNVGIGTGSPTKKLDVRGQVRIVDGTQGASKVLTSDANGNASWQTSGSTGWDLTGNAGTSTLTNFIGTTDNTALIFKVNNQKAGKIDQLFYNTFFGYSAGSAGATSSLNTGFGFQVLSNNLTGTWNTGLGHNALSNNTAGWSNTGIGSGVLNSNTTGYANTAVGDGALSNNLGGYQNTAVGVMALSSSTGSNNTAMGFYGLLNNTTGNLNTSLGFNSGVVTGTLNNASAFGSNAKVGLSNSMVLGDTSNVNVGIGTGYPSSKLHVKGAVKIVDGTQGAGKVLTSDASGNASWQTSGTNTANICFLKDAKANGTDGGTFTSGSWITRDLNTVEGSTSMVALSANQFTLQAGTYVINAMVPGYDVSWHKARLRNISDATDAVLGTSQYASSTYGNQNHSVIFGVFTISSQKVFQIQHQCNSTRANQGFGYSTSFGENEIYTVVQLMKIN